MANAIKFIATTSEKLKDLQIKSGQLIFSMDDRIIYLDTDIRTSFAQIITVPNEDTRIHLVKPVSGFYFVNQTKILWQYQSDTDIWTKLTESPKEQIVFSKRKDFPVIGEEGILYVDDYIYKWDSLNKEYIKLSGGEGSVAWELMD